MRGVCVWQPDTAPPGFHFTALPPPLAAELPALPLPPPGGDRSPAAELRRRFGVTFLSTTCNNQQITKRTMPSLRWHCWMGHQNGARAAKKSRSRNPRKIFLPWPYKLFRLNKKPKAANTTLWSNFSTLQDTCNPGYSGPVRRVPANCEGSGTKSIRCKISG